MDCKTIFFSINNLIMILNTTHIDKEKKDLINKLVGNPLSLWESLFQNKGSHRMIIESFSEKFNKFIIRISINNETVSWLVPFYKLTIYNSSLFSIHSNGNNIKFRKDRYYKINKNFINSLIEQKAVHSEKFDIS